MLDTKAWGKLTDPAVELFLGHHLLAPEDEILDDTLVELMENIGRLREVNVGKGKVFPEWGVDVAVNVLLHANLGVRAVRVAGLGGVAHDFESVVWCTAGSRCGVVELGRTSMAFGTGSVLAAGDKTLFRIVGNIRRKYGVYSSNTAVPACHLNTILASFDQRLEKDRHGGVEELLVASTKLRLASSNLGDLLNGKIANEDASLL